LQNVGAAAAGLAIRRQNGRKSLGCLVPQHKTTQICSRNAAPGSVSGAGALRIDPPIQLKTAEYLCPLLTFG
jgi:hypothetical protein